MKNKLIKIIFITLFVVSILVMSIYLIRSYFFQGEKVSTRVIFQQIEQTYNGEIRSFKTDGKQNTILLYRKAREYEMTVDARTGKVLDMSEVANSTVSPTIISNNEIKGKLNSIYPKAKISLELIEKEGQIYYYATVLLKENKTHLLIHANTAEIIVEGKKEFIKEPYITENSAKRIAQKRSDGQIVNAQFVGSTSGGYYLVSLLDERKTTIIQIHAMNGEVLSTTVKEEEGSA